MVFAMRNSISLLSKSGKAFKAAPNSIHAGITSAKALGAWQASNMPNVCVPALQNRFYCAGNAGGDFPASFSGSQKDSNLRLRSVLVVSF